MIEYSVEIWLALGLIFILLEFTTIPGIGLLFIGLGSLACSLILYHYPELIPYQITIVGLTSFIWFLLLWWPLKRFLYGNSGSQGRDYFNIVGNEVEVSVEEIKPGGMGNVTWSGTLMNARLISSEESAAQVGERLYVHEVKGNILVCSRKPIEKNL